MKVYFTASYSGKKQYEEEYRLVIDTLKDLGVQVIELVFSLPPELATSDLPVDKAKIYKKMDNAIKSADLVVAEISYPSINVGYEISTALKMEKPVLALRLKGTRSNVLEGHPDEKFKMIEYEKETLKTILEDWVRAANEQLDVRFNFFIPPSIVSYLDWVAKKRRVPRSVFLRNMIEREMKSDREFKEEKE
ncbi:MAG: hypothetical protein ACOX50_04060 [Patescibacteria group bacterium]|jgi:hypothetical protein